MADSTSKSKRKILIIEDEAEILEMYKLYFERFGYDVIEAGDGQTGIETAKSQKPDLILLDIIMPKVDGWKVVEELKKGDQTRQIPILISSNLSQIGEIEKGLDLGADDYIVKADFTPKELIEKVDKMIRCSGCQKEEARKRIVAMKEAKDLRANKII